MFYAKAKGTRIWDVDGNEFIDFTLSQGPMILGHSHPKLLKAVAQASRDGQLFAGQHELELQLAERIQKLVPCAELMRFSLSGSEADHTALRLARGATGRTKHIRFEGHYHGWFDNVAISVNPPLEQAGTAESPKAVPWTAGINQSDLDEVIVLPWNDFDVVKRALDVHAKDVAAIITEPVMCNNGCIEPKRGYLEGLRTLCDQHGIVLIFDEVITGFRLGLGGAQKQYGVTPDLAVFGKALASGYPISVIAGKRKYMDLIASGKVLHAGTMNSGNPTVAAALATLDQLERKGGAIYKKIYRLGKRFMKGLKHAALNTPHRLHVQGPGPMFHFGFTTLNRVENYRDTLSYDKAKLGQFVLGMQNRGIRLIGRGLVYISAAHSNDDVDKAVEAARETLAEL
jgi:glutamate-1-semialdehyde 2,1-aminomutase